MTFDVREQLGPIASAVERASRSGFQPLASTVGVIYHALGGAPVKWVLADLEPVPGTRLMAGELVVFSESLVAFVTLSGSGTASLAPQSEGAIRVQVLPRSTLVRLEVGWGEHDAGPQAFGLDDYESLPYAATLSLWFAGRERPVVVDPVGSSGLTTQRYAALLADLRAT